MISKNISTVAIALSALFAGQAIAADVNNGPLTRAQVKAELAEAVSTGQIFDNATDQYINSPVVGEGIAKTRAQVQAELAQAHQDGIVFDATNDRFVNNKTPNPAAAKTRAEVQAELAEAVSKGEIFDAARDRLLKNA